MGAELTLLIGDTYHAVGGLGAGSGAPFLQADIADDGTLGAFATTAQTFAEPLTRVLAGPGRELGLRDRWRLAQHG